MLHRLLSLIISPKIVDKLTCRIPTANLRQAHYLQSFSTVMINFEALRISWFVWKSTSHQIEDLQAWFCKVFAGSNVNKRFSTKYFTSTLILIFSSLYKLLEYLLNHYSWQTFLVLWCHTSWARTYRYSHAKRKSTNKWSLACFKSILKISHSNYL